jgi:hypothetical protein
VLAAELADYRAVLSGRVKEAVSAAERAVDEWVWTSGDAVRWSPFPYTRERELLPAEQVLPQPVAPQGHANGYAGGQLRLVRCFDEVRAGTEYLREPNGARTWWAEVEDGEVTGVGLLEVVDDRLARATTVRGSENVAWQWHQERYRWCDQQLTRIESSGAEMRPGGLAIDEEFLQELELAYTETGELEEIVAMSAPGERWSVYRRPERELTPEQFEDALTRAIVDASQLGLSRCEDVAIAYLAYLQQRTFPPDLLVLSLEQVDAILADDDRDVHNIAPAEWGSAELLLPYEELGIDPWQLAAEVRMTSREDVARAAVKRAAAELAAELQDVVVLAFDYDDQDEQLAEELDRILPPDAPLRTLL